MKKMGQSLELFEKVIRKYTYLFHFHTNWTDGKNSLADYCVVAKKFGFKSLVLLEHIRRSPSYEVSALLQEVAEHEERYGIVIIPGLEAKVLPGGSLDLPEEALANIQVLGIAEHSFQGNSRCLADALIHAFRIYSQWGVPLVWVHPGRRLLRTNDPDSQSLFAEVLMYALQIGVYVEFNLRYKLPPESERELVPYSRVVVGLDAHSVEDIKTIAGVV